MIVPILVPVFISAMLLTLIPEASFVHASENKILIPYMAQTPTIDGSWTSKGEWDTASEALKTGLTSGMKLFIRTGYDSEFIYVLLDFVSSKSKDSTDYTTVCLAPSNQGHSLKGYYCFKSYVTNQIGFWVGKGDPPAFSEVKDLPEGFQTANSFSGKNDPYSQDPHRIYEFKIPIKYVGSAALYAFYVQGFDGLSSTLLAWPDSAVKADLISFVGVHPPGVWGILESPNGVIPEFPVSLYYVLPISVTLTMVVVMLRFRTNN